MTFAPYSRAISRVRSFEPESTRMTSSAQRMPARVRPMLVSSSIATMATERVMRWWIAWSFFEGVLSHGKRCALSGGKYGVECGCFLISAVEVFDGFIVMLSGKGSFDSSRLRLPTLQMTGLMRNDGWGVLNAAAVGVGVPLLV